MFGRPTGTLGHVGLSCERRPVRCHHAGWTFPVMFVTAFGESVVFLSLLFPGTSTMVAAGPLVPGGTLHLRSPPLVCGSG